MFRKSAIAAALNLLLINASPAQGCQFTFPNYNSCWTSCAYSALSVTSCTATCNAVTDGACLCGDNTFNTNAAQCIYSKCGTAILTNGADVYAAACRVVGVDLNAQQFIQAGEQGQSAPSTTAGQQPTSPSATAEVIVVNGKAAGIGAIGAVESLGLLAAVLSWVALPMW